jgi:hypothetical protein
MGKFAQVRKTETAQTKGGCEIILLSTPHEASILALVDNPTGVELKNPIAAPVMSAGRLVVETVTSE